jgi:Caspase domain/Domain of unknown function (DUF4384)
MTKRNSSVNLLGKLGLTLLMSLTGVASLSAWAQGQTVVATRATELRADKLALAPVVQALASGSALRVISVEGGWVLVEAGAPPHVSGWVRASAVNLQTAASAVSSLASGREAIGNTASTLGVHGRPARVNRHALIIGISRYADAGTPPLPGARVDKQSATQMAHAMQVPQSNIEYLQDEQASADNIRKALQDMTQRVQNGDRVFIHYSGHGTRYNDPAAGGCVEALLAYDGSNITNREMADLLKTITNKTDKLFVMYDACHSGGLVQAASSVRTRGILNANDEGVLRPKFSNISQECGRPVNVKTRNLEVEVTAKGGLPQDIIHVSASRDNEISFDDELKGGLATQFMRDCMLREAKDLDGSGAISMDEIRQCAQAKINKRMNNDANYKPHNLVLNGNAAFVPAWFAQASAVPAFATPGTQSPGTSSGPVPPFAGVAVALGTPAATSATASLAAPLTGEQALRQIFDQRDAKRRVQFTAASNRLKIGQDALDFAVQSDRAGYVYVAQVGSDSKSVYLLFPNDLDQDNKIEAGQSMQLPRAHWRVKAAGPAGVDNLLAMVTDGPRDLKPLEDIKAGPFVSSLNDAQGRSKLGALLTTSNMVANAVCLNTATRQNNPLCSDAYGASMMKVEEVP